VAIHFSSDIYPAGGLGKARRSEGGTRTERGLRERACERCKAAPVGPSLFVERGLAGQRGGVSEDRVLVDARMAQTRR